MQYDLSQVHITIVLAVRLTFTLLTMTPGSATGQGSHQRSSSKPDDTATFDLNYSTDMQQRKHIHSIVNALRGLGIIANGDCFAMEHIVRTIRLLEDGTTTVDVHFYLQEHAHGKGRPPTTAEPPTQSGVTVNISSEARTSDISDTIQKCINGLLVNTTRIIKPHSQDGPNQTPIGKDYYVKLYVS